MESRRIVDPKVLEGKGIGVLKRAVEIYLERAYPSATLPDTVRRRLDWPEGEGVDLATLLANPPFEMVARPRPGRALAPIYALRLGNARYPHMKLQVQPWPNEAGVMLSVNTHDQVLALDPDAIDAQAFRDLQAENQKLKEAIEAAWEEAGLPTFLSYLKHYIESHSSADTEPDSTAEASSTP